MKKTAENNGNCITTLSLRRDDNQCVSQVKQQVQSCNCFGYKRDSTTVHDDSNISDSNLFGSKRIRIQPWQRVSGGSAFQEKWLLLQSQTNRIYLSYHMKVVINSVSLSRTYCAPQQVGALAHCTKWRWSHLWCTEGFFCCCQAMSLFPHHYWTCSVDVHRNSVYGLLIIHVFNVKPIDTVNFSVALFPPLNASPVIVCVWNTLSHWKIIWNTTLPSKMGLDPNSYVWRTAGWSVDISNRVQALDTWADALWSSSRNVPGFSVATIKQDTCNN